MGFPKASEMNGHTSACHATGVKLTLWSQIQTKTATIRTAGITNWRARRASCVPSANAAGMNSVQSSAIRRTRKLHDHGRLEPSGNCIQARIAIRSQSAVFSEAAAIGPVAAPARCVALLDIRILFEDVT